ncbi:zinc transporter ZupT [Neolewinella xylanilytica]|uniref:Zinc transporter ZupT n=1 Tax=Neolewinella xylanilytica TaxID=1514080 RepID=A0A2S6I673_9BACT|nr:ZIP family metal transporter [Neolewinella xylanilytica]PPK86611.1 zinc transporter ZupT [Neolewinella xylanilytica]
MALWHYFLLLVSALVGGGLAIVGSDRYRTLLPRLLSFSGAYLLAIAALELIPEVFGTPAPGVGVWLLLGFFIQLILEGFSQGVEHGHVHAHQGVGYGFALRVMIGLGLHALLEGLPLGTGIGMSVDGHDHGEHLLYGIVLHKLPAAFALGLLLRGSGYGRRVIWTCLTVFGLLSPLGAVLGDLLSIDSVWRARILALVVGSFLHISTTILFEADGPNSHGISVRKFLIIVAGMGVAYLTAH